MNTKDPQFKALQKEWYQKLEDSGFEDIETLDKYGMRLKSEHRRLFRSRGPNDRDMWQKVYIEAKAEYFRTLTHKVNDPDTVYKSDMDRIILYLYSEGETTAKIVECLAAFGYVRKRKSIVYLIRRYEFEWGLRRYSDRQLNRRTKKQQAMIS